MAAGAAPASTAQDEVIAFLREPHSHAGHPAVDVIETHGALVFLAADEALKIKRAVTLPYLDFSTLEKRETYCRREIEINQPNAPEIYRDVIAITREDDGRLAIGGNGTPVEWAVRMARFSQEHLLSTIAENEGIATALAADLAATVLEAHEAAEVRAIAGAAAHMQRIVASVAGGIAAASAHVHGPTPGNGNSWRWQKRHWRGLPRSSSDGPKPAWCADAMATCTSAISFSGRENRSSSMPSSSTRRWRRSTSSTTSPSS